MEALQVSQLIGEYGITVDDGQRIYDYVLPHLQNNQQVELDFAGVSIFVSSFFNAAVGQLLRDFQTEDLNRLVKFSNLTSVGKLVLKQVIENAERYYSEDEETRRKLDAIYGRDPEELE